MKKIIDPCLAGGTPWSDDTLQGVLNKEVWTALEATLNSISNPSASGNVGVIVSGCVVTLNGAGPNYDCTSGYVYMNGQFMYFAGFTNQSLPRYIVPATLVNIPKTYKDGVSRNLITQQDATHQSGLPGSGQYITLSTTGKYGNPGGLTLDNFLVKPQAWNLFTLINSWTNTAGNARWRYNGSFIEIWFHVTAPAVGSTVSTIANVPASWALDDSTRQKRFPCLCTNTGSRANLYWVDISSSGILILSSDLTTNITSGDHIEATILISPN